MKKLFKLLFFIIISIVVFYQVVQFILQERGMRDVEISDYRTIKLVNNSDSAIYWVLSDSFKKPYYDGDIDSLSIMNVDSIFCPDASWETVIKYSNEKKICIFILSNDSVQKYGLDSVFVKSNYKKKILVDIDYLEENNWTIIYR